jgi:hypothetical protein
MEAAESTLGIIKGTQRQALKRIKLDVEILAHSRQTANRSAKGTHGMAGNDAIHCFRERNKEIGTVTAKEQVEHCQPMIVM